MCGCEFWIALQSFASERNGLFIEILRGHARQVEIGGRIVWVYLQSLLKKLGGVAGLIVIQIQGAPLFAHHCRSRLLLIRKAEFGICLLVLSKSPISFCTQQRIAGFYEREKAGSGFLQLAVAAEIAAIVKLGSLSRSGQQSESQKTENGLFHRSISACVRASSSSSALNCARYSASGISAF